MEGYKDNRRIISDGNEYSTENQNRALSMTWCLQNEGSEKACLRRWRLNGDLSDERKPASLAVSTVKVAGEHG